MENEVKKEQERDDFWQRKTITGETMEEATNRYREMRQSKKWEEMTFEERRDAINRFRAGF